MPAAQQAEPGTVSARKRNGQAPKPKVVPHPTPAERAARARRHERQRRAPNKVNGRPAADRSDPFDFLEEQAASRVEELMPIRLQPARRLPRDGRATTTSKRRDPGHTGASSMLHRCGTGEPRH